MKKLKNFDFPVIFRIPVLAYLIMSIFIFIFSSVERNYTNLDLITINELYIQLAGLILLSGILFLFRRKLNKEIMSLLISFSLLLFVLLFAKTAPAFSLMIGAVIISIPPTYFSLSRILKKRKNLLNVQSIVACINIILFIGVLLCLALNADNVFPAIPYINQSEISHAEFIFGNRSKFLYLSIGVFLFLMSIYLISNKNNVVSNKKVFKTIIIVALVGLSVYQLSYMSIIAINHVRTLSTPTFDFTIFAQMFYNMRDGAGAVTTLERSQLLSHFSVHMSPILYTLLPIFMIFPFPETVQALQILVVGVGLIPLFLISKELGLNKIVTTILLVVYIFHPAIIGSSFYDFHENCFLAPMLLFVIYFLMKQKWIPLIISIALTLMIKEDASIYLVFIGLYFIFGYPSIISKYKSKKANLIFSTGIILLSVVYFFGVTTYLNNLGDGAMFWRYDNLNAYTDFGIIGIILSLFQNPSFLLATMFSPEKIYTLLIIFLFMGGIPLLSKKLSDYWLIAPLVLFNLASTYNYQHVLGFQYFYGTAVLLIFMMAVTFKHRSKETHMNLNLGQFNYVIYIVAILMISLFGTKYMETKDYINDNYQNYQQRNLEMKEFLVSIDEEKKVLATGYLTTYMADVDFLYDIQFYDLENSETEFDYIILDLRLNPQSIEGYITEIVDNGYIQSDLSSQYLMVFVPDN